MKVLVSDSLSESGLDLLYHQTSLTTDLKTKLSPTELVNLISDYDALIIRSATQVTAEVIRAAKNMKVIGRAGAGIDNIDIETATQQGILVFNTPAGNTVAAAEHTITLMLALSRHVLPAGISLRNGEWSRKHFMGGELYRKTFGIIGVGRIGSEVIRRLQAFGMVIIAYDPYISVEAAERLGIKLVERENLLQEADYISIHVPLTPETHHSISSREFRLMKSNCRLINCARGGIIDEEALYVALKEKQIASAALDVFEHEPPTDYRLMALDNFLATPHIGASTSEAQELVAIEVAQKVIDALYHLPVENAVNQPNMDQFEVLQPYLKLAERIGSFQAQTVEGQISEIRI
ncbi:MAG: phosphoglycerate dehydrogenase, partial [Candidatus Poribacteria bacterium]|nr:phosphoglycerate dehydrogenase [Candidatus Poribacteria bacterium]